MASELSDSDTSDYEDAVQFPSPERPVFVNHLQDQVEHHVVGDGDVINPVDIRVHADIAEVPGREIVENPQRAVGVEDDIVLENQLALEDNQDADIEANVPAAGAVQLVDNGNVWPILGPENDDSDDGMDNVEDGYFDDEENGNQNDSEDSNPPLSENDEHAAPIEFDVQLPARHSYLGDGMEELHGRVMFVEEGPTPEIPLVVMGIHLVPGQTLPLTIFHVVFQNAIRRCITGDRIFGIIHTDTEVTSGNLVYQGAFGTLAEIYEFQEESDNGDVARNALTGFALKAKGRQRFNVISFRRQADGNLIGSVKVRPEIRLSPMLDAVFHQLTHRFHYPMKRPFEETSDASTVNANNERRYKKLLKPDLSPLPHGNKEHESSVENLELLEIDIELAKMRMDILHRRKIKKYYSAFTPFPYFVYEQYDEAVLVEKVHRMLRIDLKGLTESGSTIPKDASELSFWLARNLTMDDHYRGKILKMDCPIQRLRFELHLLSRACKVITCSYCQTTIADCSDIFAMSVEGPQGTYVNPNGYVHETLTVHKAKDVVLKGIASTEASWFPGYSWTIAECRRCSSHLGWKFKATGRLKPIKFWGLARRSISFKYDFSVTEDINSSLSAAADPPAPLV